MTTSERTAAHGLKPLARLHTCVMVGDDPVVMLPGCVSRIVPGYGLQAVCEGGGMADATVLELLA